MQIDTSKLTANWKTTAVGLAVLAIAALQSVKFDAAGHLAMTAKDWSGVMIGVLAAVVGARQKDAAE